MRTAARHTLVLASLLVGCAAGASERDDAFGNDTNPIGGNGADLGDGGASGSNGSADGTDAHGDTSNPPTGGNGGMVDAGSGSGSGGGDGTDPGSASDAGIGTGGGGGTGTGGGGTGSVEDAGAQEPPPDETDPCSNGSEALTTGVRIREISAYQTIKVPLVQSGSWISNRATPVVQGKKTLVRVFVDLLSGYSRHAVRGVLTIVNGGATKQVTADLTPSAASTDATLASTYNFNVDGADIGASTALSVALIDPTCTGSVGTASDARFPASGTQSLGATKIGKLRVVVVPVRIGSYLPDTSAAQLEQMRKALLAHYPVPDVEVKVRAAGAITGSSSVSANGTGWDDTLNQVIRTRSTDNPEDDVYYYGIMSPASGFNSYCNFGCVLGLAPQTTRVSPDQQAGLGVGFLDEHTPETMVHELGHAHGRGHAPCAQGGSISGVDGAYPYSGAATGVWGWDSRDGTLQQPTQKDVMSYCTPTWMSDYTYNAIATRSRTVNTSARVLWPENVASWHSVVLHADGSARWGGMTTQRTPGGELEPARALDALGNVVDEIEVARISLSDGGGALLYIPEPGADWAAIELSDRTLRLADVAAALDAPTSP